LPRGCYLVGTVITVIAQPSSTIHEIFMLRAYTFPCTRAAIS
jgi:hypothetical protein